jgi:hypothetical protein
VPNEILKLRVPAGLALAFYRVVALPERPLAKGTASGGAEVFGYADRFSEELDRLARYRPNNLPRSIRSPLTCRESIGMQSLQEQIDAGQYGFQIIRSD